MGVIPATEHTDPLDSYDFNGPVTSEIKVPEDSEESAQPNETSANPEQDSAKKLTNIILPIVIPLLLVLLVFGWLKYMKHQQQKLLNENDLYREIMEHKKDVDESYNKSIELSERIAEHRAQADKK